MDTGQGSKGKTSILWGVLKWFPGVTSFGLCRTMKNYVNCGKIMLCLNLCGLLYWRWRGVCTPGHPFTEMAKCGCLVKLCNMRHQTVIYTCRFSFFEFSIWWCQITNGNWKEKKILSLGHLLFCWLQDTCEASFDRKLGWNLFCLEVVQNRGAIMSCLISSLPSLFWDSIRIFFFLPILGNRVFLLLKTIFSCLLSFLF